MTAEKMEQARELLDKIEDAQHILRSAKDCKLPRESDPRLAALARQYKARLVDVCAEELAEAERLFAEL